MSESGRGWLKYITTKGQEEAGGRQSLEHVMEEGMRPCSAPGLESLFGLYREPCAFLPGHNPEQCRISHPRESACTDKTGALNPRLQQFAWTSGNTVPLFLHVIDGAIQMRIILFLNLFCHLIFFLKAPNLKIVFRDCSVLKETGTRCPIS